MTPDTIIARIKKAQFTRLDGELLAIDADAGFCYSLNETGAAMWDALEQPMSIGDLSRCIGRGYAVDGQTCVAEVTALAVDLERAGLVRVEPHQAGA